MTPVGTIWRRALRRVNRRAAAYNGCPCDLHMALLREACRLANRLSY